MPPSEGILGLSGGTIQVVNTERADLGKLEVLPGALLQHLLDCLSGDGKVVLVFIQPGGEVPFDVIRPTRIDLPGNP